MIFSHNTDYSVICSQVWSLFNIDFYLCMLTPYISLIIHKYFNINPISSHDSDPVTNEQLHSTFVINTAIILGTVLLSWHTHMEVIRHFAGVDSFFLHLGSHSSLQSFWQVTLWTNPVSFYYPNVYF